MITVLAFPLSMMAGGLLGAIAHETAHAVMARLLGQLHGVGWQGGITGGAFVEYSVDDRWRSEVVRKTPLVLGALALVGVALNARVTVTWVGAFGVSLGLLWTSPADMFIDAAKQG